MPARGQYLPLSTETQLLVMVFPSLKWQIVFFAIALLIGALWAYSSQRIWIELDFQQSALKEIQLQSEGQEPETFRSFNHPASLYGFSISFRNNQLPTLHLITSKQQPLHQITLSNHGSTLKQTLTSGSGTAQQHLYWDLQSNEITPLDNPSNTLTLQFSSLSPHLQPQSVQDFLYAWLAAQIALQLLWILSQLLRRRFGQMVFR